MSVTQKTIPIKTLKKLMIPLDRWTLNDLQEVIIDVSPIVVSINDMWFLKTIAGHEQRLMAILIKAVDNKLINEEVLTRFMERYYNQYTIIENLLKSPLGIEILNYLMQFTF